MVEGNHHDHDEEECSLAPPVASPPEGDREGDSNEDGHPGRRHEHLCRLRFVLAHAHQPVAAATPRIPRALYPPPGLDGPADERCYRVPVKPGRRASPGDTTAPASSLGAGATARIQQLHWVHAPNDASAPGHRRTARITIDADELVIGREPEGAKTLVVNDTRVSRVHAALVRDRASGEVEIVNRDSRHGTVVDGARVERARLRHGSVIRLGDSLFVFADTSLRMEDAKVLVPETATLRGSSLAMDLVRGEISLVAPRAIPVLVLGETGVGKERVAQEIHRQSRRGGPLVAVNCAAIPEALAETELFGHAAGAFTGATQRSEGMFVAADGGTLFLDEVAELPLPVAGQAPSRPRHRRDQGRGEERAPHGGRARRGRDPR